MTLIMTRIQRCKREEDETLLTRLLPEHRRTTAQWLILLLMLLSSHSVANDLTIEFRYKVVAASCTLNVDNPSVTLGGGRGLQPKTLVGQSWKFIGETDITVTLSACAGSPGGGALPYVDVTPSGDTVAMTTTGLYRSKNSTSTGFGVVIGNIAGMTEMSEMSLITPSSPGIRLEAVGGASNKQYKLRVGVACGDASRCGVANLRAGTLNAAFTLDFIYR